MHTHVYANNQEIACRAVGSDGVSPSAFPDACWSPPAPSAGPVLIPYPNTCEASHISNGTTTVFIGGQTVAIADQSYFSTSTGNEGATEAFSKGSATGVIKGKAYFTQWSSDVMFEGFGVPRHLDLVSHNHGSMPSNTPVFPYVSRGWLGGHKCEEEEKRIKRACQPDKDDSEARSELKKQSKLAKLLKANRSKGNRGNRDSSGSHWTDDHCDGLDVMLVSADEARAFASKMQDTFKALPDELQLMSALQSHFQAMVLDAAGEAAAKWAAKAAAKQLAGSALPAVGNAAMGLWSAYDAISAVGNVAEIRAAATEALGKLDVLQKKASALQDMAKRFGDLSQLKDEDALKLATEGQDMLATLNDCTRARKCNLVPYKGKSGNLIGQKGNSKVEAASDGGCCAGQSGHHLIPEASLKGQCPNYDHDMAPTVCVEGRTQNHGSHKRAHQELARAHSRLATKGKVGADGSMSMADAIDSGADSHKEAFPLSNCSKDCIKEQLDSYYKMCRGARPQMINAQAKLITPPAAPSTTPTPRGR